MDIIPGGGAVRSLAIAACIVISSTWAALAHAQYDPYSRSEKELRTTESVAVRTTQHLGNAVAAGGNIVLSVGGAGSLYAFAKNAQGAWAQTAKLTAPDGGALTGPIAFDGTNALVRGYTPAEVSVVYYFQYDGSRWRALAILRGAANFGHAIAMDGCTALISSAIDDALAPVPAGQKNFVHFFDRCGTGQWTYINSISPPASASTTFGWSVAVSGLNALVGSPTEGFGGHVYHYIRAGNMWSLRRTFHEFANPYNGQFGNAVAISSDLAVVSANYTDGGVGQGQIIRFAVNGNTLSYLGREEFYTPFDAQPYEGFGEKIIITPANVFVSAPARRQSFSALGWVYAFPREGATELGQPSRFTSYDKARMPPEGEDLPVPYYLWTHFGSDIAVTGSTLVVGAEQFHVPGKPAIVEGRLFSYDIP